MAVIKKCRHGRGLHGAARRREWRACGCVWLADIRVDGRREYVPLGVVEADAVARHAQLIADRAAGRMLKPASVRLADVADAWLDAHRHAGRKPRTLDAYTGHVRLIKLAFTGDVSAITGRDIAAFRRAHEDAGRDPDYVALIVGSLMGILRHAVAEGMITDVPVDPRPVAKRARRDKARRLTLTECEAIIAAMRRPWRDAAELVLLTGLRIGEVLALTPGAVDLDGGRLVVAATRGKGGRVGSPKTTSSERTVTLTPRAVEILRARVTQARPHEYLWEGSIDGAARDAFRDARAAAGIDVPRLGWHSLRHGATALMDAAGLQLRGAAQQLGHGGHTAMTMGYGWTAEAPDVARVDAARERLTRHHGRGTGGPPSGGP